jgi:hypothetical protein
MKKGKVFFHPIDGSGSLTISWSSMPKGDGVEASKGSGVGFFSEQGDLLAVIFDEVKESQDSQVLEFDRDIIEVTVKHGKATYEATRKEARLSPTKRRSRRKIPISKK